MNMLAQRPQNNKNKILALGGHIDDVELSMGGSLFKHVDNGDEIIIAVIRANDRLAGDPLQRQHEQLLSAQLLGNAKVFLFDDSWTYENIVAELDKIDADTIYFPYSQDTHHIHNLTTQIGYSVARKIKIKVIQYLAVTSHTYYPNYLNVINITEKKKLVSVFRSQMERQPKFMEIMEAQNRFFGSLIPGDGHYAEGFVLHRLVRF